MIKIFVTVLVVTFFVIGVFAMFWTRIFPMRVVVGPKWVNQAQFAGIFVAKERGIFRNNGLDVKIKEFNFNTNQISNLLENKVDFAIVSPEEYLLAKDQGKQIMAVAAYYQVSPYVIVSLMESKIKTPADFNGKILGNKGGKIEEDLIYGLLLNSVGLTEKDVTLKKVGFDTSEVQDLNTKNVQAIDLYRTDQLYLLNKENLKYNVIYPEQYGLNTFNDVLVVRTDFIDKNPEIIRKFIAASIDGWDRVVSNYDEAVSDTLEYVTLPVYKDREYEKFILKESMPLVKTGDKKTIGRMNYYAWEKLYTQMKLRGFVKGDLKVDQLYNDNFLPL